MSNPPPSPETSRPLSSRSKPILFCVLLIIGGGVAHGYLDGRWTSVDAAQAKAEALQNLPLKAGDWDLLTDSELEGSAKRILQCYGSLVRTYVNKTTGAEVSVFVVCGPRGPIAVHTPEVCYSSSGTEPAGDRVVSPVLINGESQSLWTVKFRKPRSSDPPHLEVWYGWSDGGPWKAASVPRVWLTDSLYKIQASGPPAKTGEKESPVEDFLRAFLPSLQKAGVGLKQPKSA